MANNKKKKKNKVSNENQTDQNMGIYSLLKIGMSIYIGINSLDYEISFTDQQKYGYYPCPNAWFIVHDIRDNEDKTPIIVLQRHP